jgi:mRNA interferase MazF
MKLQPGALVIVEFPGAQVTKLRPAVVVSTDTYHAQRPDAVLGILTSQTPPVVADTDYLLKDWSQAGLRAPSWFRLYLITAPQSVVHIVGRLTQRDWEEVRRRLQKGLAVE